MRLANTPDRQFTQDRGETIIVLCGGERGAGFELYPALKRGAKLVRPSGAWTGEDARRSTISDGRAASC
jgi:hypothetical protein